MSERFVIDPKHVAEPETLRPDIEAVYSAIGDDPAKCLLAFLAWSKSPKRGQIGFGREDLEWLSRAWKEAAIATDKGRVRDLCLREADRYSGMASDLVKGELARREEGIVFLTDNTDWPHPEVMRAAITSLNRIGRRDLT